MKIDFNLLEIMGACVDSDTTGLPWYNQTFGTELQDYDYVMDVIATDSSLSDSLRAGWLSFGQQIITWPATIKYDGNYTYGQFRARGPQLNVITDTYDSAAGELSNQQEIHYRYGYVISTDNDYFKFSQSISTANGSVIKPFASLELCDSDADILTHFKFEQQPVVVLKDQLQSYLNDKMNQLKQTESSFWRVERNLMDGDKPEYNVWELWDSAGGPSPLSKQKPETV